MARPAKEGLDYFPLDVGIFEDEKIEAIAGEFGIKGELAVIKLLCAIYKKGYFILWDDLSQAVIEEVGEVGAALARNNENDLRDGIGDMVVTLIILAMQNNMDLYECLNQAYSEIKNRQGKMVNGVFVKEADL